MSKEMDNPWKTKIGHFISKTTVPRGHAETPGTGPKSETCGSCGHLAKTRVGFKCKLMKKHWTAGRASNVRAKDQACYKWEKGESDE